MAAVVFLACYSWLVLQPGMPRSRATVLTVVDYVTWLAFVVDYIARLVLARPRRRWFVRNLPELVIVGLPVLRPLRLLRLVSLVRVLNRRATASFHGRVGLYVLVDRVRSGATGSPQHSGEDVRAMRAELAELKAMLIRQHERSGTSE